MKNRKTILSASAALLITFILVNGIICLMTRNHSLYGEISVGTLMVVAILAVSSITFLGIYLLIGLVSDLIN